MASQAAQAADVAASAAEVAAQAELKNRSATNIQCIMRVF